jgi:hypothetical protein
MEALRGDVLGDAHRSLTQMAATLESLVTQNQAMTPVLVEGCQHAIATIGGGGLSESMVSLEAFDGDPIQQTAMSLEALKDNLKKVWEAIKLAIKRAIQAISDFISKLFGGLAKLEKKVTALLTKADDLIKRRVKTDDKMMITNVSRIMLNNNANPKIVEDGIQIVYKQFYAATTDFTGVMGMYQKQILALVTSLNFVDNFTLKGFEENDVDMTSQTLKIFKGLTGRVELPGGRALRVGMIDLTEVKNQSAHAPKILRSVKIVDHPNSKNPPDKIETKIPSAEWVSDRLNEVRAFTKAYTKDRREQRIEEYNSTKEATIAKFEKSTAPMGSTISIEEATANVRKTLDYLQRNYSDSIARLDSYAFRYMRAVVSYLEDCLDALEKATSNSKEVDITR